jgi:lipoprotein-anchoring transpeptidase ErfK/SrfK
MRLPVLASVIALTLGVLGMGTPASASDLPAGSAAAAGSASASSASAGSASGSTVPAADIPKTAVPVPPRKVKKPVPATRSTKAKNVPERPMDGQDGRRIVYDKSLMTVWAMNAANEVVFRFPIVGRWDRPAAGEYKVYSKSERSGNSNSRVTFDHMTRFAYGNDGKTPIGFHSIPIYYDGRMMHGVDQLGLPIATGGCVRMHENDAQALYEWSKIGDRVVVLASP